MPWVSLFLILTNVIGQDVSPPGGGVQIGASGKSPANAAKAEEKNAAKSAQVKNDVPPLKTSTARGPRDAAAATVRPRRAPSVEEVRVRSQAEMNQPKSPFLMAPGSLATDRYGQGGDPDWSLVPPWRQTTFFGVKAQGLFFVYVVDCSGSMIDDDRMPRATIELRRSVLALQAPQKFEVIFYNTDPIPMPGGPIPRSADMLAKNQLMAWLRQIEPDGGTDPRVALKQALWLQPDAVFLLSDGAFPETTCAQIARLNTRKIPIHCVDLAGGLAGDQLKRIARENGGRYVARPGDMHGRP